MSRLDSMINRLVAQRMILNHAADLVAPLPGPVLELGLGNGRTFDHLREIMPDREIFVFERKITASPRSIPDAEHVILGEIRDTLPFCAPRIGGPAALIHSDLSNGDPTDDLARKAWLSPMIAEHAGSGTVVISGHELDLADFERLPLPEGIREGRYYLYRKR
ncbi:class I SAM-dependent methyltransferase [Microbaculum marinisediminis]|uniref:Class I SAM-dependent methyltransferase n=1 Tax=Microbaculum marinisediminis TaxID=2931392 RepID=A0AAW5QZF5_9HYPH|nr:class I SAM-dependent methyltransferase [Microbaculum sp. A6E488]MCT8973307.1 class I SAM-dependent methyltransferase [Microbaculum sp. A6E488]